MWVWESEGAFGLSYKLWVDTMDWNWSHSFLNNVVEYVDLHLFNQQDFVLCCFGVRKRIRIYKINLRKITVNSTFCSWREPNWLNIQLILRTICFYDLCWLCKSEKKITNRVTQKIKPYTHLTYFKLKVLLLNALNAR